MQPNDYLTKATTLVQQAQTAEERDSIVEAHTLYVKALSLFNTILQNKQCLYLSKAITPYASECLAKAQELDLLISTGGSSSSSGGGSSKKTALLGGAANEEKDRMMQELILTRIEPSQCTVSWADIVGSEGIKRTLDEIIRLPRELPHLYTGNRKVARSVLLYGPPGTGKTLMGKAMAREAGVDFFSVSSAELISKYVGESEKYIKCLFEMVKAKKPCILFLDEVDALCSKREEGNHSAKTVQQFLTQLDGITNGGTMDGVFILACTNLPWALDEAMRRRLEHRIYLGLPSPRERDALLRHYVSKNEHCVTDTEFGELANCCEYFSSADIQQLCASAAMIPLKEIPTATHFELLGDGIFMVRERAHEMAMPMLYNQVVDKTLIVAQPVAYVHLLEALEYTKSTVDVRKLEEYDAWTKQYGCVLLK